MISWLFADVQKLLQISIFSLKAFRERSLLFVWVAARLLHTNLLSKAEPSYLHIYPTLLHVVLPATPIRAHNDPLLRS